MAGLHSMPSGHEQAPGIPDMPPLSLCPPLSLSNSSVQDCPGALQPVASNFPFETYLGPPAYTTYIYNTLFLF